MELHELTIHEAHELLDKREVSSVELTKAVLERISQVEPEVHAIVTVTADTGLRQAEEADKRIRGDGCRPLTGIPAIIKDNMCTK
ncbi:MAG: amidase family protein, partial [Chloroflexota bacterium]|nr:amidase family protein [Chloroflexota bacterium]